MTWEMLWAVGRYDLRLTDEEFWHMVPRQFAALMRRREEMIQRAEFGPAIICQMVCAAHGQKMSHTRFMPSWKEPKKAEVPWQEMRARLMTACQGLGGVQ